LVVLYEAYDDARPLEHKVMSIRSITELSLVHILDQMPRSFNSTFIAQNAFDI